jgi:hypothetical protein
LDGPDGGIRQCRRFGSRYSFRLGMAFGHD